MNLSTAGLRLAADASIDLHLHTIYSDGYWMPESLLDHLLGEQFDLAAVTDHDRVDTVAAIQHLALQRHLPLLIGVEMSTTWMGEMVDLLCYGFDVDHNALNDLAQCLLRRQQENTREVYETLQQRGYIMPRAILSAILAQPGSKQPHALVDALKENGYGLGEPSAG